MTKSLCNVPDPSFTYNYCPSYPAAVLFAVLFSLTTAGHVYQAVRYRKPFAGVLIMGGIWEILGYIIRTLSVHHPYSAGLNTAQMLLILLAPLWINAFIYMLAGRTIHMFLVDDDRVFRIKARRITLVFVVFDITAFLVQGTGGSMSSSDDIHTALNGLHIYTGGVALQIFFIAIFMAVVVRFHLTARSMQQGRSSDAYTDCLYLLRIVYWVIGLILLRNFYRLAEYASGLNSTIIRHEWYAYVFDAVPMLAAIIIMNVFHPGPNLQGTRCDFSEENKAIKLEKRRRRAAKPEGNIAEMPSKAAIVSTQEV